MCCTTSTTLIIIIVQSYAKKQEVQWQTDHINGSTYNHSEMATYCFSWLTGSHLLVLKAQWVMTPLNGVMWSRKCVIIKHHGIPWTNLLQLGLMHLGNLHQQLIGLVRRKLDVSDVVDAGAMFINVIVAELRLYGARAEKGTGNFRAWNSVNHQHHHHHHHYYHQYHYRNHSHQLKAHILTNIEKQW